MSAIVVQRTWVSGLSSGVHLRFSVGSSPIQLGFKQAACNTGVNKQAVRHV
jgi:hypothetical protein